MLNQGISRNVSFPFLSFFLAPQSHSGLSYLEQIHSESTNWLWLINNWQVLSGALSRAGAASEIANAQIYQSCQWLEFFLWHFQCRGQKGNQHSSVRNCSVLLHSWFLASGKNVSCSAHRQIFRVTHINSIADPSHTICKLLAFKSYHAWSYLLLYGSVLMK